MVLEFLDHTMVEFKVPLMVTFVSSGGLICFALWEVEGFLLKLFLCSDQLVRRKYIYTNDLKHEYAITTINKTG